jgi:hypothetical protein
VLGELLQGPQQTGVKLPDSESIAADITDITSALPDAEPVEAKAADLSTFLQKPAATVPGTSSVSLPALRTQTSAKKEKNVTENDLPEITPSITAPAIVPILPAPVAPPAEGFGVVPVASGREGDGDFVSVIADVARITPGQSPMGKTAIGQTSISQMPIGQAHFAAMQAPVGSSFTASDKAEDIGAPAQSRQDVPDASFEPAPTNTTEAAEPANPVPALLTSLAEVATAAKADGDAAAHTSAKQALRIQQAEIRTASPGVNINGAATNSEAFGAANFGATNNERPIEDGPVDAQLPVAASETGSFSQQSALNERVDPKAIPVVTNSAAQITSHEKSRSFASQNSDVPQGLNPAIESHAPEASSSQPVTAGDAISTAVSVDASAQTIIPPVVTAESTLLPETPGDNKQRATGKATSSTFNISSTDGEKDLEEQPANFVTARAETKETQPKIIAKPAAPAVVPGNNPVLGGSEPERQTKELHGHETGRSDSPRGIGHDAGDLSVERPVSALNAARMADRIDQTEFKVGVHSVEFGTVGIRAFFEHRQLIADISTGSRQLGSALAADLPGLHEKLATQQVAVGNITISGDWNGSHTSTDQQQSRDQRQYTAQTPLAAPLEFTAPLTEAHVVAMDEPGYGLDIRI